MSRHKVEITGVNTANLITLTNEEMNELFIAYQSGDLTAKEKLVNGNLKLVLSILKRFSSRNTNMDDLFQVGCIGLIKAIDNFNLSYGLKLSTYAVPLIMGEIKRSLRDSSSVRISRSIKDLAYKVLRLKEELDQKSGKETSIEELSKVLEVGEYDIIEALEALKDPISMFEPIYNDGGDTIYLYDQLEDKKQSIDLDSNIALEEAIKDLNEREKFVLNERFIIGKTQMEIAEELTISQAQVSRIEKGAISVLKKVLK